ncbi:MAG: DUF1028 domain-containing protein [Rhizobacter sp.]|nr:DUF1028 domain-containing protein [Chlorobiales bacterium]
MPTKRITLLLLSLFCSSSLYAQNVLTNSNNSNLNSLNSNKIEIVRPCHTYSIVARDAATGELGVAVQSHWFSVGSLVAWAEAGVGAVATQATVDAGYGPKGLDLMRQGMSSPDALKKLLSEDKLSNVRQVAMVDAKGKAAAHTGSLCIVEAGHFVGDGFTTEANLMLKSTVWDAMQRAFTAAKGSLTDRLIVALEAAQAEGGDVRGQQSAAMVVVSGTNTGRPWVGGDVLVSLRVEDHPKPVEELKRLVALQKGFKLADKGDEYFAKGEIDNANKSYAEAEKQTGSVELAFWHAVTLATGGRVEEALPIFKRVFESDANWAVLLPRLPKSNLFPNDPKLIEKVLSVAPKKK